jgi:hypothetical protein
MPSTQVGPVLTHHSCWYTCPDQHYQHHTSHKRAPDTCQTPEVRAAGTPIRDQPSSVVSLVQAVLRANQAVGLDVNHTKNTPSRVACAANAHVLYISVHSCCCCCLYTLPLDRLKLRQRLKHGNRREQDLVAKEAVEELGQVLVRTSPQELRCWQGQWHQCVDVVGQSFGLHVASSWCCTGLWVLPRC